MGFSLVAAAAIIGLSVIMVIEIIVGTTVPTVVDVQDSFEDMKNRAIEQVQTNINITDVTSETNGSGLDINITVENTGSVTLETKNFNILVNGTVMQFSASKSYLFPEKEVYFNVSSLSGTGDRRLKIITNNGISDFYDFNLS